MKLSTEYLRTVLNPAVGVKEWLTASFKEDKRIMIEKDFNRAFQFVKENWRLINAAGWARYIGMPLTTLSCAVLGIKGSRGIEVINIPPQHKEAFIVLAKQFGLDAPRVDRPIKATPELIESVRLYIVARKHLMHVNVLATLLEIPTSTMGRFLNPNDKLTLPKKYEERTVQFMVRLGFPLKDSDYVTE